MDIPISTIELLPNEILLELFEKYIDGIDIFVGFVPLNHQRLNSIILQCSRFYLDFRHCHKVYFCLCLHSLQQEFIEKVEELILSEQNTPSQIQQFFLLFPSFTQFKRLRKLYLNVHDRSIDWMPITSALESLSTVPIETISIHHANAIIRRQTRIPLDHILTLTTLKRLSFIKGDLLNRRFSNAVHSSRIKYLKYSDMSTDLPYNLGILQHIPYLEHLDITFFDLSSLRIRFIFDEWHYQFPAIGILRTLILTFMVHDSVTIDVLKVSFKMMSALQRLEITAHQELLIAESWEDVLKTSLPSLTHFRLKSTKSRLKYTSIDTLLDSFETLFWREKENFYLIITEHKRIYSNGFYFSKKQYDDNDELSQPAVKWWIVPKRVRKDVVPTRDIISLGLTDDFKYLSDCYYFKNIKYLIVYHLDTKLVECLSTSVDCFRIEHLDLSFFDHQSNAIPLLLSCFNNLISLKINYQHLFNYQTIYSKNLIMIKYLDISIDKHNFSETDIIIISNLFPQLNHLAINTRQISNISLLKIHLPKLWSLTYSTGNRGRMLPLNVQQYGLTTEATYQWTTIWIDDEALNNIQSTRF